MLTFIALQLVAYSAAFGQTTREVEKEQARRASSRTSKGKLNLSTYVETQKNFEKRMKNVAKEHKKRDKMMKKPQYSDPTYFGHRRPPKIRPVGKRKMCKECGIVH